MPYKLPAHDWRSSLLLLLQLKSNDVQFWRTVVFEWLLLSGWVLLSVGPLYPIALHVKFFSLSSQLGVQSLFQVLLDLNSMTPRDGISFVLKRTGKPVLKSFMWYVLALKLILGVSFNYISVKESPENPIYFFFFVYFTTRFKQLKQHAKQLFHERALDKSFWSVGLTVLLSSKH